MEMSASFRDQKSLSTYILLIMKFNLLGHRQAVFESGDDSIFALHGQVNHEIKTRLPAVIYQRK